MLNLIMSLAPLLFSMSIEPSRRLLLDLWLAYRRKSMDMFLWPKWNQ